MLSYSGNKEFNTREEVFYDYIKDPGWNNVRIGYKGIEYNFSQGDNIGFQDRDGQWHEFIFPPDVETLLDAHVLEDGLSLRELMNRDDIDYFEMD